MVPWCAFIATNNSNHLVIIRLVEKGDFGGAKFRRYCRLQKSNNFRGEKFDLGQ